MSKEIEKVDIEEATEVEEVETEKFGTKAKGWFKRNGKKIVAGAATLGVAGLAFVLGKKYSGDSDSEEDFDDLETEFNDTDDEVETV